MVYQSFKYFLVRLGVSFFLLFTLGFMALYFFHEIALPGTQVNDAVFKAILVAICLFFGFGVYGSFGEYLFLKNFRGLRHVDFKNAGEEIARRFRQLLWFTESSYFLPGKARRLRADVIHEYANFLLNAGREDDEALNVYLKAFLHNPHNERFRNILVSVLTQKPELAGEELDLLLMVLKATDYQDIEVLEFVLDKFLEKNWFTSKTEPVYSKALETGSPRSPEITRLMLPVLIEKKRADRFAVRFYLNSLKHADAEQKKIMVQWICRSFWEGRFKVSDPELHARCQDVFESLEPGLREKMIREFSDQKIGERWRQVRLFQGEDKEAFKRARIEAGIEPSGKQILKEGAAEAMNQLEKQVRSGIFCLFDKLQDLGSFRWVYRMFLLLLAGFAVYGGLEFTEKRGWWPIGGGPIQFENPLPPQPVVKGRVKVHTIQVAAVTTQRKANQVVRELESQNVKNVYVIKTPRQSGGFWYKIRVGKFFSKEKASLTAQELVSKKLIRNYFILSIASKGDPASSIQRSPANE